MRTREEITEELENAKERLSTLENNENTDEYDDFLNDAYGPVKIGTLEYDAARVLKEVDEVAYNCGHNDYNDNEISNLTEDIEELEQELKDLEEPEEVTP
jgi:hypothetical protein